VARPAERRNYGQRHKRLGPWLAAMAVVFDGTLLAYFVAVPVYLVLKAAGATSVVRVLVLFSLAGVLASQLVHVTQGFRQPGLREFAVSWLSPLFGCLCGLVSGACFFHTPKPCCSHKAGRTP
jgi:hypothetical protein